MNHPKSMFLLSGVHYIIKPEQEECLRVLVGPKYPCSRTPTVFRALGFGVPYFNT